MPDEPFATAAAYVQGPDGYWRKPGVLGHNTLSASYRVVGYWRPDGSMGTRLALGHTWTDGVWRLWP